ncbi:MAG: hypothetical protein V1731_03025 [Candidatus Aenigmatarchaeota archaeon]
MQKLVCFECKSRQALKCKICKNYCCDRHSLPVGYRERICSKCAKK